MDKSQWILKHLRELFLYVSLLGQECDFANLGSCRIREFTGNQFPAISKKPQGKLKWLLKQLFSENYWPRASWPSNIIHWIQSVFKQSWLNMLNIQIRPKGWPTCTASLILTNQFNRKQETSIIRYGKVCGNTM